MRFPCTCGEASWDPVRALQALEQAWVPKVAPEAGEPKMALKLAKLAQLVKPAAA